MWRKNRLEVPARPPAIIQQSLSDAMTVFPGDTLGSENIVEFQIREDTSNLYKCV